MINLHAVIRGAITAIHPDEKIKFYVSEGKTVDASGFTTPKWSRGRTVIVQIQADSREQYNDNPVQVISKPVKVYMNMTKALENAMDRHADKGGDMFYRPADKRWYLITGVQDDFVGAGWRCFTAVSQINPPKGFGYK